MESPTEDPAVNASVDNEILDDNPLHTENENLKVELEKIRKELDESKSEVAVAQILNENLGSVERQKCALQEELATMQILLSEANEGNQDSVISRLKTAYKQLDTENQDLKIQLRLTEGRRESGSGPGGLDKETLLGGAAVISDVTKNLARRVKSSVATVAQSHSPGHSNMALTPEERDLEESLVRASQDAEALKAIVVPLEEQIVALKGKLRETDSMMQEYERRQAEGLLGMEAVGEWLVGKEKEDVEKRLVSEVGEGYSGGEGQLYHAMLAARIGMLVLQMDQQKREKDELLAAHWKERRDLKDHLEKVQGVAAVDREQVERIRNMLTDQQKEQLGAIWGVRDGEDGEMASKRVISPGEWGRIQASLDMVKVETGVQHEGEHEEMEQLKNKLKEVTKERDHLANNCEKYKDDLNNEASFRKEMESTWNSRGEEYRSESTRLTEQLGTTEEALAKLSLSYRSLTEATRRDLRTLTTDREKVVAEMKRLQDENDNLVGKHSTLAEEMASEVINLPDQVDEMQLLLLTYREDLIAAKLGKERAEERLRSEKSLMKAQLTSEQGSKEALEKAMGHEISEMRTKVVDMDRIRIVMEQERERRKGLEKKLKDVEVRQSQTSHEKEKEVADKGALEGVVSQLRSKVSSLQADLDNSVAVQNDFVRLSQSLQVELEKIRQAEKEVRWQHEEDVEDCNTCRNSFSVTRRKHHCRHCGRVFCSDCVSKQVPSGPNNRPSRVCDVCHTLLNQHSAPYFSTEAPQPQD